MVCTAALFSSYILIFLAFHTLLRMRRVTAKNECTISFELKSIELIYNFGKSCLFMIETLDKKLTGLLSYCREICASCGTLSLDSLVREDYPRMFLSTIKHVQNLEFRPPGIFFSLYETPNQTPPVV